MSGLRFIAGKTYGVCPDCGSIVRVDKPLFGSLHICALPGEITSAELKARVDQSRRLLSEAK